MTLQGDQPRQRLIPLSSAARTRAMLSAYEDGLIPPAAVVDCSRPFIADSLTPLFYTRSWKELTAAQRLTYNQISGTYWNELISWFELELAETALRAMAAGGNASLVERLKEFLHEEGLHAEVFHELNRRSDPSRYADRRLSLVTVPRVARVAIRFAAARGLAPALLWILLLLEERSIAVMSISTSAGIDDLYALIYRAHAADESRHVAVDLELLERAYVGLGRTARRCIAASLQMVLKRFLLRPGPAAGRVLALFIARHPELRRSHARMLEELSLVGLRDDYRRSMYSDDMTPRSMARLRTLPEMAGVLGALT